MSTNESIAFEYHGQNIKGTIKGLSLLELADEQRGRAPGSDPSKSQQNYGIIMDKTDVTIMKAPDSLIKIKASAKKCVFFPLDRSLYSSTPTQTRCKCYPCTKLQIRRYGYRRFGYRVQRNFPSSICISSLPSRSRGQTWYSARQR
jgi:hypothetical protein